MPAILAKSPPVSFIETQEDVLAAVADEFDNCPKMLAMYRRYFAKATEFLIGRNRCVFMFRTYVVKLPLNYGGLGDNDWEASVSNIPDANDSRFEIQYARTRLAQVGDIPVLFMERVEWVNSAKIKKRLGYYPRWVDCVDCGQVGFNRAGKLLAFDYGLN